MNEEKQIEEMAKDLCECYVDYGTDTIDVKATAEKLTAKGCRKASEVAKETLDRLKGYFDLFDDEDEISVASLRETIAKLKKKYESEG